MNTKKLRDVKIVIIGDYSVGKSSILQQIVSSTFNLNTQPTLSVTCSKVSYFENERQINLNFWDTAGQERFNALTTTYFRSANFVFLVVSANSFSMDRARFWLDQMQSGDDDIKVYFVINKIDLMDERITYMADHFAAENDLFCVRTSAKTGQGIDELIEKLKDDVKNHNISVKKPSSIVDASKRVGKCC